MQKYESPRMFAFLGRYHTSVVSKPYVYVFLNDSLLLLGPLLFLFPNPLRINKNDTQKKY